MAWRTSLFQCSASFEFAGHSAAANTSPIRSDPPGIGPSTSKFAQSKPICRPAARTRRRAGLAPASPLPRECAGHLIRVGAHKRKQFSSQRCGKVMPAHATASRNMPQEPHSPPSSSVRNVRLMMMYASRAVRLGSVRWCDNALWARPRRRLAYRSTKRSTRARSTSKLRPGSQSVGPPASCPVRNRIAALLVRPDSGRTRLSVATWIATSASQRTAWRAPAVRRVRKPIFAALAKETRVLAGSQAKARA